MQGETLIDYTIEKLTKLLIETDMEERKNKKKYYVRKRQAYIDLINLLKDIDRYN